jgi:hypothetical protein
MCSGREAFCSRHATHQTPSSSALADLQEDNRYCFL